MRNRLFSLVLALSMILMAVPGLGSITVAAAEDTAIIEYDATKLREIYTSGSYASSATMLAPYGITVNTTNVYGSSDNAIVDKTSNNTTVSSVMGVRTAGMPAVKFDFKKWGTATAEEGGGFDLTKTSDINPNVTTMDGSSTYMVETRFITYIYDGTAKTSYLRYELRGVDASGNLLTIARLRFDRATNTIYLVDTEDNVIGSAAAAAFGLSLPIPGYVRFVADLEQQTYSAYLALYEIDSSSKFVDEATMKAVPEELIVLAQNQPFLSNGIKQLTRLDVSGRFDGSGNVAASFYNVKASQMADASVDNATANYDLQVGGDLTATLTPVTHRLQKITLDDTDLTLTDDYTVSENTFTILEDTLKTLAVGEHTLTFVMDGGANPTVTITVSDTPLVSTGDTTIIEYDAADLLEIYNAALEGDSTVTAYNAIKDYGISLSNCWSGGNNALGADANVTGGVTVLRFGFSNSATTTEAERGGIDLTKESTLNPAVPVMDGDNTYMLEAQFVTYIYDSSNKSSIIRYELRGTNSSGEPQTIARLRFDRATDKIYLVDASDTAIGSAVATTFGQNQPIPGYVRFVVDMESKIYSAYLALHDSTSGLDTVPENLTLLAQNQPFLNSDVTQLTRLDISGIFPGGGNAMAGFYNVKASQMADASVDNATANYDLQVGGDLTATLTPVTHRLQKITLDGTDLTLTDDYTVSENTFTILEDTLKTLAVGEHTLTFVMDGGANPTVTITVSDSTLVPPTTYTVTATSANDTMGSATVTTEGTAFEEGASVTVTATAAEGNKFTGWTAEGITLTEEQKTQNPLTITMPAGNVTLTAAFEAKTNATITPATADYDKYSSAANHAAIDVTLTAGDYAFNALKNGETTLSADTDYIVNGNTYTITTTYLDTLATGATALTFDMDGGTDPTLTITVADSTPLPPNTYTVTATSADATKGTSAVTTEGTAFEEGASVTVTATAAEGNKFTGWTAEGITLTEEQKTQNPLTITMPAGNVTLTAAFEADEEEETDTTITVTEATYDKNVDGAEHQAIEFSYQGSYTLTELKNGETTLEVDTDYTVEGNTVTILTNYLDALPTGTTVLTLVMSGGTNPTITIVVTDTSEEEDTGITPNQATYDKYAESADHKDLVFTLTNDEAAVVSVKLGDAELEETTDYTMSEGALTILTSVLDELSGEVLLTVELEDGTELSAEISITDTTPTEATYKVTVSAGTGGTAHITTAKEEYLPGERVIVSATAASGYTFSNWSSNDVALTVSGTTASFTMPEKDVTVYAYFTKNSTGTSGGRRTTSSSSTTIAGSVVVPIDEEITEDDPYQAPTIDHVSSNYFNDTDTYSTWAYGYIEHLAAAGIVSGDQNGNYNPKNVVTREEFLKMLMGALGIEATTTTGSGYSDVNSGDWYAPYIYTGTELGLVNGMGDGTFGVGQLITRQDMAVMASRALAIVSKTLRQDQAVELTDLDTVAGYARSSVEQLAAAGVICGDENAAYRPADSALREDAAKIIYIIWKS